MESTGSPLVAVDFLVFLFGRSGFVVGLGSKVELLAPGDLKCSRRVGRPFDRRDLVTVKQEVV